MIQVCIINVAVMVCFTIAAVYFDIWWLVLIAPFCFSNYSSGDDE